MDQIELEEVAPSDGQVEMKVFIHIYGYQGSLRDIQTDFRLKEMENQKRMQEVSGNNLMMFNAELQQIRVNVRDRICNNRILSMI